MTKIPAVSLLLAPAFLAGCVNLGEDPAPRQAASIATWYSGVPVDPDPYAGVNLNAFDLKGSMQGMAAPLARPGRKPDDFSRSADTARIRYSFTAIESAGDGARLLRSGKRPWSARIGDITIFAPDDGGPVRFVSKDANGAIATLPLNGKTILLVTVNYWKDSGMEREAVAIR